MSSKQNPLEIPELLDLCIGSLASSRRDLLSIPLPECVAYVLPHLSSSIEHLEVAYDQKASLKPITAFNVDLPMQLRSLGLTVGVRALTKTPQTPHSLGFYPFDLTGLKAFSISCLSPIQWDTIPTHALRVLDIDPMDEETPLDLSLFPELRIFRITIFEGLPPMVPATLAKISQCSHLHTIVFVVWGNTFSGADCALLDWVLSSPQATSRPRVVQFLTMASSPEEETLSSDRFPRLMARNMLQMVTEEREVKRWWQDRVLEL
ncbi:hypothetical protein R3P38DRAFT_3231274 [Favolaschia claudopus]|uniref:Uncharacterized protein n=1 Tax=Favolaschia claudopus TaxID=2862362 RepID=A0AAV9ZKY1_9AGAR